MTHQGKVLKSLIKRHTDSTREPLTDIVKKAGYSQASIYRHFANAKLAPEVIWRYGKAIAKDMSADFPDYASAFRSLDDQETESDGSTLEACIRERDLLQKKYTELLEKHNALLTEKLSKK